ncbi:xanthine phosphoribosyltransferase [Proteiniclasticum sp. QWL-01]|uniref:xanthine phosphoribosyltransferase n=1 Tax=Proteiniclasticum sp. QWL-01 TaxID=3036945 RepID=UPI002200BBBF|nr:xanthine phosphoribosyltransferase [Proteiniclasticum sp. QWL-01]UUM11107.1 xanthine phosphoribosyltransferase [Clostridiaceae bacterium HFYG-1003]WFF72438.1 xanthine phosphoribosyltransferase [Proteiniclasticum sp. QWL-01]
MKLLEEKILKEGRILPGEILKVDQFINHMIDTDLFMEMGREFYEVFKDQGVTKILTLEVSGIAMAYAAAWHFHVPVLFAKKIQSLTLGHDVYTSQVYSYTKQKKNDIVVDRKYLLPEDRVLIIDDFLANGEALKGLIDLADQAGSTVVGIGIGIEKAFQPGGRTFRDKGYHIHSLARIERFDGDTVTFCENDPQK